MGYPKLLLKIKTMTGLLGLQFVRAAISACCRAPCRHPPVAGEQENYDHIHVHRDCNFVVLMCVYIP